MNSGDDLWVGEEPATEDPETENLKVSVERVAGKLTFNVESCFDPTEAVPVYEIAVGEPLAQGGERCRAIAKNETDPERISSWIYGDASSFDVKKCEPLEPKRTYIVRIESSDGCFGFEGSKRFEIREDGSIQMSGRSCFSRSYPPADVPTSAP